MEAVDKVLDELQDVLESARSMPMSASCVVNRGDVLGLVDELRLRLPDALAQAREVLGDRRAVVDEGHREAERILARAQDERGRMLGETDVMRAAREQAERIVGQAREVAEAMRVEVEDYVDAKLATFEVVLNKTLEAVDRGRHKLAGHHDLDELRSLGNDDDPLPG